jgi:transglutaminase-like putative cysteine protease
MEDVTGREIIAAGSDIRNHLPQKISTSSVTVSPTTQFGKGSLPIALYTTQPQGAKEFTFYPFSYCLAITEELKSGYSFQGLTPVFSPDEIRTANVSNISNASDLLTLPKDLPQRVRDLATQITQGKNNNYDKLEAIIGYLQQYTYDKDNAPTPFGKDAVDYFLFEDKRGVCSTFSSAFVVMARAVGIPARVVGGWAIAPVDSEQIVKADQAHQWAEVPFDGLGWVTFEATPGGPTTRVLGGSNPPSPTPTKTPNTTSTPILDTKTSLELENGLKLRLNKLSDNRSLLCYSNNPGTSTAQAYDLPPKIPIFEVSGAAHTNYLRVAIGEEYNNGNWTQMDAIFLNYQNNTSLQALVRSNYKLPVNGLPLALMSEPQQQPSNLYTDIISLKPSDPTQEINSGVIPTSLFLQKLNISGRYRPGIDVFYADAPLSSYTWQSNIFDFSLAQLNSDTTIIDTKYSAMPSDLPIRIKRLAQQITTSATTPYQKAKALESYLQTHYEYRLGKDDPDFDKKPLSQDPVDWFLFDHKRGTCCNFSSAFVVLARSIGLPARVVSGWPISSNEKSQIIYADQAHQWTEVAFSNLGWVTFDPTGGGALSRVPVASKQTPAPDKSAKETTTTEIISTSNVIHSGEAFNVSGIVKSERGAPVDGISVEIYINSQKKTTDGVLIGKGATVQGTFDIEAVIPDVTDLGNYQLLAHSLGNNKYLESWSDPQIKVVADTAITLNVPERVKISETVTLQGKLTAKNAKLISGQRIDIYINNVLENQFATDSEGQFTWKESFNQPGVLTIEVKYPGSDFQIQSSQKIQLQVLIPTMLSLEVQENVKTEDSMVIKGTLRQEKTNDPIPNQPIKIIIDGQSIEEKITTDQNGGFSIEHVFSNPENNQIEAKFVGDSTYWESDSRINILVETLAPSRSPFVVISVVLAIIAMFTLTLVIFLRQKRGRLKVAPQPEIPASGEKQLPGNYLKIEFPQIRQFLPHVWGFGDELGIVCHLANQDGTPLVGQSVLMTIGQETFDDLTDKDGNVKLRYTFKRKGEYNLKAYYNDTSGSKNVKVECRLRIVDYREEIVDIFKALSIWLRNVGIKFAPEATPREIQRATLQSRGDISTAALESIVSYFEEANFSLHPISRNTYEDMYLAQTKIKEHEQ